MFFKKRNPKIRLLKNKKLMKKLGVTATKVENMNADEILELLEKDK